VIAKEGGEGGGGSSSSRGRKKWVREGGHLSAGGFGRKGGDLKDGGGA